MRPGTERWRWYLATPILLVSLLLVLLIPSQVVEGDCPIRSQPCPYPYTDHRLAMRLSILVIGVILATAVLLHWRPRRG